MSSSVNDHYANHLGPVYSWMTGDFGVATRKAETWFNKIGLRCLLSNRAADLGCGHGIQSIPLARLGFCVTAIDTCQLLLDELKENAKDLPIQIVNDDLLNFSKHIQAPLDACLCMGDTLLHLESRERIKDLVTDVARTLVVDGAFCLSYRDYTGNELRGNARFIPVRSDDERIHTCFLEYQPSSVRVHDIIQTRSTSGWETSVSSYEKLRVSPKDVETLVAKQGFQLTDRSEDKGMIYQVFRKVIS